MSEESRSPTIATRSALAAIALAARHLEEVALGLAGDLGDAARRRSRPRPGSSRSPATRRPASASSGRGWWRTGRRRRRAPASRSAAPRSRSRGGRRRRPRRPRARPRPRAARAPVGRDHLLQRRARRSRRRCRPRPPASPARRAATIPAVTICSAPDLDPQPAQPLRVGGGRLARVVGDEDDPLAAVEQRRQRLRRARHRLAADPDDPVEVDQKSVESSARASGRRLLRSISIRCRSVSTRTDRSWSPPTSPAATARATPRSTRWPASAPASSATASPRSWAPRARASRP